MTGTPLAVLRPRPVDDPALRLYLLHHAGGSHLVFRPWRTLLPAHWEICLVVAPGRAKAASHPAVTDLRPVSDALARHLSEDTADVPYALFGHSMGALAAFGAALTVADLGGPPPRWVGVSGSPGPYRSITRTRPPLFGLPPDELRSALTALDGLPERVLGDPDLWERVQPMVRADLQAAETWLPPRDPAVLDVPLTAFCGDRDPVAGPDDVRNWAAYSTRFRGVVSLPGGHFYFRSEPSVLVARIVAELHRETGLGDAGAPPPAGAPAPFAAPPRRPGTPITSPAAP